MSGVERRAVGDFTTLLEALGSSRGTRVGPVVRPAERQALTLDTGVVWERLGELPPPPGRLSPGHLPARRHLRAGDSFSFESTTPHSYCNDGTEPVVGIWFVLE